MIINKNKMNFSAFVARRYLFSKKSHNVINIISLISVFGVATGAMALIIVLSVYNGFDGLIKSVFSTFDPDIKITIKEGKVFDPEADPLDQLKFIDGVAVVCPTLEEMALLEYDDKMNPSVIKGVPPEFESMTGVDTMMVEGEYKLTDGKRDYAVVGAGVSYFLSIGLNFITPIKVYVPKRTEHVSMNPSRAFNQMYIYPSGKFSIQQEIDSKYVLVPIDFARRLLSYPTEVSALELKLKPKADVDEVQSNIEALLGENYVVKNKYQQHEVLFRVMKSEKWAIYMILTFILIVASFNIIGSLAMLIIDKKNDLTTLKSLGLDRERIRKIFLIEGWMISIGGALVGLLLGALVCLAQQYFGLIKLSSMGTFLVDNMPVKMQFADFVGIFVTVVIIGLVASWYPVKYFTKKYLQN